MLNSFMVVDLGDTRQSSCAA